MRCKWYSQRRKVQCQHEEHNEDTRHYHSENGRTVMWDQAASFIPKDIGVAVVIPDSFRAVKRGQ